jgi:hypothetical protein
MSNDISMNYGAGKARETAPAPGLTRRWYAFNDNGDWMELLPSFRDDPFVGAGVSVHILDVSDDEEFFERADNGDGDMIARVILVDGELTVLLDDDLGAWEREVLKSDDDARIDDAVALAISQGRDLGRVREYRLRHGRYDLELVMVDAGVDELGTVVPVTDAVALYDWSVGGRCQFVALIGVDELLRGADTATVSVGGGGGTLVLTPAVLTGLKHIVEADRERARCAS